MTQDAQKHFDAVAKGHRDRAYQSLHTMNAVRLKIVMDMLTKETPGTLLDAGCGDGFPLVTFMDNGWDAYGVDLSPNMVREAQEHLEKKGYSSRRVSESSLVNLSAFEDNLFDVVTCLGVMYYIEDDALAYKEINRILKPGGIFICSQQNELFDLFTFNKYTLRFFRNNILPLASKSSEDYIILESEVSDLITNPEAPIRHDGWSSRDAVFTRPENPLIYAEKLRKFNMLVDTGPLYFGIHLLPPLVLDKYPSIKEYSNRCQYDFRFDWRGLFIGAHFIVSARKNG